MDDNAEYAKLLSSVNIANTGLKRQLSPSQVAEYIERLIEEEGFETTLMLLPIGKKIISDFRILLTFPESVQNLIIWGASKDGALGFSVCVFIGPLKKPEDRELLCKEAAEKSLSVKEIKEIVGLVNKQDKSLIDTIENITKSRPKITHSYMVVISFLKDIQTKIKELVKNTNQSIEDFIIMNMEKKFQISGITTVAFKGENLILEMNKQQYENYKTKIKENNLEFNKITEFLVS